MRFNVISVFITERLMIVIFHLHFQAEIMFAYYAMYDLQPHFDDAAPL